MNGDKYWLMFSFRYTVYQRYISGGSRNNTGLVYGD